MTKNARSKRRTRAKAREGDEPYTRAQASRTTPWRKNGAPAGGNSGLTRAELNRLLDEAERAYRQDEDPFLRQAGYSSASRLYDELATHTDDPTWKHAARLAAGMLSVFAARTRWEHGIPTLHPQTEAHLLGLGVCESCGRPWQSESTEESCDRCPRLLFGPSPQSLEESARLGAGEPINLRDVLSRHDRGETWD
ncbi:hypothetical protein GCM10027258_92900 [Amycolatopsis stemonae]